MAGTLQYSISDYELAARTYRRELLRIPLLSLERELSVMTLRPGVRYEEAVGASDVDVELHPYRRNERQNVNLDIVFRILKTNFGTVNADFDPNYAISTLIGHRAVQASGDALASTPQAQEVLATIPKKIGRKLKSVLFNGKYDPKGNKTADLFDGFDTITADEIAAGNIAQAKGNYIMLSSRPDAVNAVDLAKEILYAMSPELREENCVMFCSQQFYDDYVKAYKMESGGISYNESYDQLYLEGSMNRIRIMPLVGKAGSDFIHVCPASNMLVGVDQLSDKEHVRVKDYEPDTITMMMRMFWGVQFESIDPRRFIVAQIPAKKTDPTPTPTPDQEP